MEISIHIFQKIRNSVIVKRFVLVTESVTQGQPDKVALSPLQRGIILLHIEGIKICAPAPCSHSTVLLMYLHSRYKPSQRSPTLLKCQRSSTVSRTEISIRVYTEIRCQNFILGYRICYPRLSSSCCMSGHCTALRFFASMASK